MASTDYKGRNTARENNAAMGKCKEESAANDRFRPATALGVVSPNGWEQDIPEGSLLEDNSEFS